ncbi:MAG: carbon storage regulator [Lachnospiraceae bacterium]|nr:carbon storage regulator [Lachnospiraceae bacterium]
MLKLSVKPGEYVLIGEEIKVVFTGGSSSNLRILVEAPKDYNIVRSGALERYGMAADPGNEVKYHRERELSPEAKEQIKSILMAERKRARREERAKDAKVKYGM